MKFTALLMIILIKLGINGNTSTLSSCRHNRTIEFLPTDNKTYQLKLCLSDSKCFESKNNIMFPSWQNSTDMLHDFLEGFDCNCSQCATTTPDSSDCVIVTSYILIALLTLFAVLLAIVTAGWMCTCWAMKKRRREMSINTTTIR